MNIYKVSRHGTLEAVRGAEERKLLAYTRRIFGLDWSEPVRVEVKAPQGHLQIRG